MFCKFRNKICADFFLSFGFSVFNKVFREFIHTGSDILSSQLRIYRGLQDLWSIGEPSDFGALYDEKYVHCTCGIEHNDSALRIHLLFRDAQPSLQPGNGTARAAAVYAVSTAGYILQGTGPAAGAAGFASPASPIGPASPDGSANPIGSTSPAGITDGRKLRRLSHGAADAGEF